MTCSVCQQPGHNKLTCPLLVVCETCKQLGHSKHKCTYKALYDTVTCLPKDIIKIIHDFKCSYDEYEWLQDYYFNLVFMKFKGDNVLTNIKIISGNYINTHSFHPLKKVNFVSLLEFIYQHKEIYNKLFIIHPNIKIAIQQKIQELNINNLIM